MLKKIDHIGIAVRSIAKSRKFYEDGLGLACERIEVLADQKVRAAFFTIGETHIELLEPMSLDSPIAKFIDKRGEGIHHISYLCDTIKEQLNTVKKMGCQLINEEPITGAGEKQIAFLHPQSTHGVLTELCALKDD